MEEKKDEESLLLHDNTQIGTMKKPLLLIIDGSSMLPFEIKKPYPRTLQI